MSIIIMSFKKKKKKPKLLNGSVRLTTAVFLSPQLYHISLYTSKFLSFVHYKCLTLISINSIGRMVYNNIQLKHSLLSNFIL